MTPQDNDYSLKKISCLAFTQRGFFLDRARGKRAEEGR